jgi:hypothetical protein
VKGGCRGLVVRKVIDRRFYRSKYDAARTVAAFSETLRNEIDLSQLQAQLVAVVEETMQPTHVSLWLRAPEASKDDKPGCFHESMGNPQRADGLVTSGNDRNGLFLSAFIRRGINDFMVTRPTDVCHIKTNTIQ